MMRNAFAALLLVLALGGCAIGNQHQYNGITPQVNLQSERTAAVAVQDRRPYILNKDKDPNFVGLSRGGFGNPFNVTTESGNALAVDVQNSIVSALKARGIDAVGFSPASNATPVDARQILGQLGRDRFFLITMNEWKSDTYMGTALLYDVRLAIFDKSGNILGENAITGRDDLGGSAMNPPSHAKTAVPAAFKQKIEQLLDGEQIRAALR